MIAMPKVTVVIPCYNQGEYIDECLDSVFNQTYHNIEIIIVNDGSTDDFTNLKLSSIKNNNSFIKVFNQKNSGLSAARNTGIKNSTGKYIMPLDADDMIHPEYIEKAVEVIDKNSGIGIVYSDVKRFGEVSITEIKPEFNKDLLLIKSYIRSSALFKKTDWEKVGGYNSNMKYGMEEWDFWLSIVELGKKAHKLKGVYFFYRIKKQSMAKFMREKYSRKIFMHFQLILNHQNLYSNYYSVLEAKKIFNILNFSNYKFSSDIILDKKILKEINNEKYDYNNVKMINLNQKIHKFNINIENQNIINFYPVNQITLIKIHKIKLKNKNGIFSDKIEILHNADYNFEDNYLFLTQKPEFEIRNLNNDVELNIELEFLLIGDDCRTLFNNIYEKYKTKLQNISNYFIYGYSLSGIILLMLLKFNSEKKLMGIYDQNTDIVPEKFYVDLFSEKNYIEKLIIITSTGYAEEIKEKLVNQGYKKILEL